MHFSLADELLLVDIYSAGEQAIPGLTVRGFYCSKLKKHVQMQD